MSAALWFLVGFFAGGAFVFAFVAWLLTPLFDGLRAIGRAGRRR